MPFKVLVVTHAILVLGFLTGHGASVVTRDWWNRQHRGTAERERSTAPELH